MPLRVLNNEQSFDERQDEGASFSKICFIPSLKLSCFGCCGHHFGSREEMHAFFDENKQTLDTYRAAGKSYRAFMEREKLLDSCGGCYSLIREQQPEGHQAYVCAVHPLRIGSENGRKDSEADIRVGYCDHDYLCKTAAHVNKMDAAERKLFYQFLKEQAFDSFTYSLINEREVALLELYHAWRESLKTTEPQHNA